MIEVRVPAEHLAISRRIGAIHVNERDVEVQRRDSDELFPVVVRRLHGSEVRIDLQDIRPEARAGRQERKPLRCRPKPQKEHSFVELYRVDRARSRKLGGTGLGLAIVKHIVQAHHGRVTIDSMLGIGSTFTIHLPKADPKAPPAIG